VTPLPSRSRSLLVACLVIVAFVAAPAAPAGAATWNGRFSIWRNGAYTTQYLDYSCVGAAVQITLNLVKGTSDRSKAHQLALLAYANQHSQYPVEDSGADPQGWAQALIHFGAGSGYGWTTSPSLQAALQTAAVQIRQTHKPVGLLVHFGAHAWLMTGFESTADPATTSDFQVTAAEVLGPLWPLGTLNGQSFDPGPGTWMATSDLARKFNVYTEPSQPLWDGKYVTVVPNASEANQPGQEANQLADLESPTGWIFVYQQLSKSMPVRDFLWFP
jgi:hypothetical protein